MTTDDLERIRRQFVEAAGHATQMLGFGRIIGQTYMHIFFSRTPMSLDGLTSELGISKGSASMTVRQLESWGALRKIWVKGDRKDYYEAIDEFGRIIRKALVDLIGRNMETTDHLLKEAQRTLAATASGAGAPRGSEAAHLQERIARLHAFRKRAQGLWESPIIRRLLK